MNGWDFIYRTVELLQIVWSTTTDPNLNGFSMNIAEKTYGTNPWTQNPWSRAPKSHWFWGKTGAWARAVAQCGTPRPPASSLLVFSPLFKPVWQHLRCLWGWWGLMVRGTPTRLINWQSLGWVALLPSTPKTAPSVLSLFDHGTSDTQIGDGTIWYHHTNHS